MTQVKSTPLWSLSDEELMVRYQQADERAFEVLYDRHAPKIFGYLVKKIGDRTKADEVMQAAFLKLHASRAQYDRRYPVVPWLFTICRTVLIDTIRRGELFNTVTRPLEDLKRPLPSTASAEERVVAAELVAQLSGDQQAMIRMRYEEGLSFEEMATRLEVSPAAVRQRVSRVVRSVKTALGLRSTPKEGRRE